MMRPPRSRPLPARRRLTATAATLAAVSLTLVALAAGVFAAASDPGPAATRSGAPATAAAHRRADPPPRGLIQPDEWAQYRSRFISSGRVVDDANGHISHSEGQGYGMMLAVLADDRATFAALWSFVRTQLLIRDDGLTAWRWHPSTRPHVSDVNNAGDGDILIAHALLLGADAWDRPDLIDAGRKIMSATAGKLVFRAGGRVLLRPGVDGFGADDRTDGPVVNPSYWVFEALQRFAALQPDGPWQNLIEGGLGLIDDARFGPAGAPAEWVSLHAPAKPRPAEGFPAEYGYNALRIPLYLLRAGIDDRARLERFRTLWTRDGKPAPAVIDLRTGAAAAGLDDPGYAIIAAALACAVDGTPVPEALRRFRPTLYYPSTLHLLGLSMVRQRYPQCL